MTSIFAEVVNMSSMAIWLILAVIVVRLLCQKVNKNFCYLLWALVGIRLLCPFTIESTWSLVPEKPSFEKMMDVKDEIFEQFGGNEEGKLDYESLPEEKDQTEIVQNVELWGYRPLEVVTIVWSMGVLIFFGYTVVSFLRLKKRVAVSVRKTGNVWLCDAINSPFVLGFVKPRIYVPTNVEEEPLTYVVAHEKAHLQWHDHIWKLVGVGILAIHWFNPLVWISYMLFCRDIELACDERVIKGMNEEEKRNYAKSLLSCSSPTHFAGVVSVAFGEISIRKRVKGVLNYKKASFWMILAVVIICGILMIGFMTNPKGQRFIEQVESELKETLEENRCKKDVIYEITADLNHDGVKDLVQVFRKSYSKEGEMYIDYPSNTFYIECFLGKEGGFSNTAVKKEVPESIIQDIWVGRELTGLYAITQYEGKDYLLFAQTGEIDGNARYIYYVVDVMDSNEAKRVDYSNITFACDPFYSQWDTQPHREDVVPEFREKISPWLENAIIILCSDEDGIYVAEKDKEKSAKEYFDLVWQRSDVDAVKEYEALKGEARWEKIIRKDSTEADIYVNWIKELATSDLSYWYEAYNGEERQRINHHEDGSQHCSLSKCCDIIYMEEGFISQASYKMFREMVEGKSEKGINCTYQIHAFGYPEQPIVPITENMWLIRYFNGYYGYSGEDEGVSEQERFASARPYDFMNDIVSLPRDGAASEYWFILMKKDGVYRLERLKNMMQ